MNFDFLIIAGSFSLFAAVLYIGIVIGGPSWYRFSSQERLWHKWPKINR
ncbi:MAG: hypothetical protein ACJAWS_000588 [Oleiphilaceae bacterium]|jgi:hypothetical protein